MKKKHISIILLIMNVFLLLSCSDRKISVAISAPVPAVENLQGHLSDKYKISSYSQENISKYSVVWFHKEDSAEFSSDVLAQKDAVADGGYLLLTMDAVRLLEHWEVKPENESRWMVYPGKRVSRLYTYGKGRILALVAYISLEDELAALLDNSVSVMKSQIDSTVALPADSLSFVKASNFVNHSHGCQHVGCKVCEAEYRNINISRPIAWNNLSDKGNYVPASDRPVILKSERLTVVADEKSGIDELWVDDQVKAISRYGVFLDIEGGKESVPLSDYKPVVSLSDNRLIRRYNIDGQTLTETIAVADSLKRVALIHYEWDELPLRQMIVDYTSDLSLAWPFADMTSSLFYTWSLELNGGVTRDQFKQAAAVVGANVYGRNIESGRYSSFTYDDWRVAGVYADELCTGFSTVYGLKGIKYMDMVIAASADGIDELLYEYAYVLMFPEKVRELLN